jgi:hypothetical protein
MSLLVRAVGCRPEWGLFAANVNKESDGQLAVGFREVAKVADRAVMTTAIKWPPRAKPRDVAPTDALRAPRPKTPIFCESAEVAKVANMAIHFYLAFSRNASRCRLAADDLRRTLGYQSIARFRRISRSHLPVTLQLGAGGGKAWTNGEVAKEQDRFICTLLNGAAIFKM